MEITKPKDQRFRPSELDELTEMQDAFARKTEDLRQQQDYFRRTLAGIGDGDITAGLDSNVTLLNSSAEAITGWRAAEVVGQLAMAASAMGDWMWDAESNLMSLSP